MFSNLKEIDDNNAMVTQNAVSKAVCQNFSAFYKVKTQRHFQSNQLLNFKLKTFSWITAAFMSSLGFLLSYCIIRQELKKWNLQQLK